MSGYGLFQPSTLGMKSQSHRLNTIGYNIANVNTGGFKRTDTQFETVLSKNFFAQSDTGGVKPYSRATNDIQGLVTPTNNELDLAIVGKGFFALQPELTASNQIFYTRDGSFSINTVDGQTSTVTSDDNSTITVANGYLVDKNGYFVLGSPMNQDGTFTSSAAAPMRVDQYAFVDQGQPTSTALLDFNLPSTSEFGDDTETYTLTTYDSAAAARQISFDFVPMLADNEWRVNVRADNLTSYTLGPSTAFSRSAGSAANTGFAYDSELRFDAAAKTVTLQNTTANIGATGAFNSFVVGDQITFSSTNNNNSTFTISAISADGATITVEEAVANESTGTATVTATSAGALSDPMTFSSLGQLSSNGTLTLSMTWDNAETSDITIDVSSMTQFAGAFTPNRTSQNGIGIADLADISFDNAGNVVGTFSDGTERTIYKIPLYDFTNPNGLEHVQKSDAARCACIQTSTRPSDRHARVRCRQWPVS
ncbi:MAG: flagellar hook-basal body complex protein [Rhodospirillales bacterium]|nr:flagellar hook-basal body complex protein [Rhodospirillales bacterium]MBO6787380.1 flagellar hook-basal body complex protein [Rhodospirillales bacterium]